MNPRHDPLGVAPQQVSVGSVKLDIGPQRRLYEPEVLPRANSTGTDTVKLHFSATGECT